MKTFDEKKYRHDWYIKNKDKIKKRFQENYQNNKEAYKLRHRRNQIKQRYGVTYEFIIETWEKQNRACAICERVLVFAGTDKVKGLAIDHDHKTGKFRGILCHLCNSAIGLLQEDMELVRATVKYLEDHE